MTPTLAKTGRLQTLWRRTVRLIDELAEVRANGLWAVADILERRLNRQVERLADEFGFQQGETNEPEEVSGESQDSPGQAVVKEEPGCVS